MIHFMYFFCFTFELKRYYIKNNTHRFVTHLKFIKQINQFSIKVTDELVITINQISKHIL
jgi:hypothetical protein